MAALRSLPTSHRIMWLQSSQSNRLDVTQWLQMYNGVQSAEIFKETIVDDSRAYTYFLRSAQPSAACRKSISVSTTVHEAETLLRVEKSPLEASSLTAGHYSFGNRRAVELALRVQSSRPPTPFSQLVTEFADKHCCSCYNKSKNVDNRATKEDKLTPIAIIGMSVKFPQSASNLEGFWEMLLNGRSAISDFPEQRLNINAFFYLDENKRGSFPVLDFGAHINALDSQSSSALYLAYTWDYTSIAIHLVNHVADVSTKTERGDNPLLAALRRENNKVVELLLDRGADLNSEYDIFDGDFLANAKARGQED
ncbi:uncharacterized protein KY384_002915 [Bacidia gigantensis]|uniref:uncharacterized protein n=1 Tax=Bacidia gigantensis TaxID=2732470 RepID=UPI001D03F58B|nr:uncharacterized protein KY384_002915 [Bacidia gigantensis]KAG8532430.1 hypothetical protein KY384_002915 [Bacidia gigantensis]